MQYLDKRFCLNEKYITGEVKAEIKITDKIDPIRASMLQFFFGDYLKLIGICGGRIQYVMLEEYIKTHYSHIPDTTKLIKAMEEAGFIEFIEFSEFQYSKAIELSSLSLKYFGMSRLYEVNKEAMIKSSLIAKYNTNNKAGRENIRNHFYRNNNIFSIDATNEIVESVLKKKNCFIADFKDNTIEIAYLDYGQNIRFDYLVELINNHLIFEYKFNINILCVSKARADEILNMLKQEYQANGDNLTNENLEGLEVTSMNVDKYIKNPIERLKKAK